MEDIKQTRVVMEASEPYYVKFANYLYAHQIAVSVVNPLKIKRFSQMKFYRAKTDKKDSCMIMEYGVSELSLPLWKTESRAIQSLKQLRTTLELLQKQLGQITNQQEAYSSSGVLHKALQKSMKKLITSTQKTIQKLESQMHQIYERQYKETLELLTSIPGIGHKTAIMLIETTDNFSKFDHYKQLIAYVGLAPKIYQSGTSVHGKGHIYKMGKAQIRKLLYMCSWSAKYYNKACKEMYDRLKAKGKPERVIKVTITNKLLKQAFAIVIAKQKYMENYQTLTCF